MRGEVNADQADAFGAHVGRETESDVRRVLSVVENIWIGEIRTTMHAQVESDHVLARQAEIELREDVRSLGALDVVEAVTRKLVTRIHYDQVIGIEATTNVVDSDRDESRRIC